EPRQARQQGGRQRGRWRAGCGPDDPREGNAGHARSQVMTEEEKPGALGAGALTADEIMQLRRLIEKPAATEPAVVGPGTAEISLNRMAAGMAHARDRWSSGPSWLERSREACPDDVLRAIVRDQRRSPAQR